MRGLTLNPIPAAAVTVGARRFTFDKGSTTIMAVEKIFQMFGPGAVFCESLKPGDFRRIDLRLGKVALATNLLDVYQFTVSWFSGASNDTREFLRTEYYFVDNGSPVAHRDYVKMPTYPAVMSKVEQYRDADGMPLARGGLSTYLKLMQPSGKDGAQHPPAR